MKAPFENRHPYWAAIVKLIIESGIFVAKMLRIMIAFTAGVIVLGYLGVLVVKNLSVSVDVIVSISILAALWSVFLGIRNVVRERAIRFMVFKVGEYAKCIETNTSYRGEDRGQAGKSYKIVSMSELDPRWLGIEINGKIQECLKSRFIPAKVKKPKLKISDMLA